MGQFGLVGFGKSIYMGTQPTWIFFQKEASSTLQYHLVCIFLLKFYCKIFSVFMEFLALKNLIPYVFFLLWCFFVLKYRLGRAYGSVWPFWFWKIDLHGDSANVDLFSKRSVFRSSISLGLFFPAKILLHGIFGIYRVFGTEKTPSIRIFPSLMFFRSEISSWTGVRVSFAFLVLENRFTWGLSQCGSFFKKKRLPLCNIIWFVFSC